MDTELVDIAKSVVAENIAKVSPVEERQKRRRDAVTNAASIAGGITLAGGATAGATALAQNPRVRSAASQAAKAPGATARNVGQATARRARAGANYVSRGRSVRGYSRPSPMRRRAASAINNSRLAPVARNVSAAVSRAPGASAFQRKKLPGGMFGSFTKPSPARQKTGSALRSAAKFILRRGR